MAHCSGPGDSLAGGSVAGDGMAPDSSALQQAIDVMDRLRSPGGCPWDAEQTHASLARYLVEETYEVLEAIELDDAALLREELGDVLLQVLFHARLAQERTDGTAFSVQDVAADLAAKLIRRHPHVFATGVGEANRAATSDEVNERWEAQKAQEKARTSVADGVPMGLPALALAGKLVSRAERAGLAPVIDHVLDQVLDPSADADADARAEDDEARIGAKLLEVTREAVRAGVDAESALRAAARRLRDDLISAEGIGG
jgi:XTP/dITP diphosphohydrolase